MRKCTYNRYRFIEVPEREREVAYLHKTIPSSSQRFIGRLAYREKMDKYFNSYEIQPRRRKMFLLYGIGGIGKSEISIKYAEDHSSR